MVLSVSQQAAKILQLFTDTGSYSSTSVADMKISVLAKELVS